MICENCKKEHDGTFGSGRFCSRSCSNKRNHSIETKRKISSSLGGKGKATEENRCPICNKIIDKTAEACTKHCKRIIHNGGLALVRYERRLKEILEREYGSLQRTLIEGRAFDFNNNNYIIEFTFDYGRGSSDIIKAFEVLKNLSDHRHRIAYIPSRYVGIKRKNKLRELNVEIKFSDKYKYLLKKDMRP